MKKNIQRTIQLSFLILFILLIIVGNIKVWMGIFVLGIVLSFFVSRLYCGFACPINTIMIFETYIKRKLKIKSFKSPKFIENKFVRYLFLGLFFALFLVTALTGKNIPVLPGLLILGFVITLFFEEKVWHRYLCPYGTILSFPSKLAKKRLHISPEKCNNCGACARVCPANAITKDQISHSIIKNECINCFNCQRVCKQNAIKFN